MLPFKILREHSHKALIKSGEAPFNTALIKAGLAPHKTFKRGTFLLMREKNMGLTFAGTLLDALMERCWFLAEDGLVCPDEDRSANNHEGLKLRLYNFPGRTLLSLDIFVWRDESSAKRLLDS